MVDTLATYRPEYQLSCLRTMQVEEVLQEGNPEISIAPDLPNSTRRSPLLLRWLRTVVLDMVYPPLSSSAAPIGSGPVDFAAANEQRSKQEDTLQRLQEGVVGCAMERLEVLQETTLPPGQKVSLLRFLRDTPTHLTSLNLRFMVWPRDGNITLDQFLHEISVAHPLLRRLVLPRYSNVSQAALNPFRVLEVLDVWGSVKFTNVDFCSGSLRVLVANYCTNLTDHGLRLASRLEVLIVPFVASVSCVTPFSHCLRELDARGTKLSYEAIAECPRLQVLHVGYLRSSPSLQPYPSGLRELTGDGCSDAWASYATKLVRLEWSFPATSIGKAPSVPLCSTLRVLELCADDWDSACLAPLTRLVILNLRHHRHAVDLAPVASTLLELTTGTHVSDATLTSVTQLMFLDVSNNKKVTTVAPFGPSLRHVVACDKPALGNEGLASATRLVSLDVLCSSSKLTTIEPFRHTLEMLSAADSYIDGAAISSAPQLREVRIGEDTDFRETSRAKGIIPEAHLVPNGFLPSEVGFMWRRHTFNSLRSPPPPQTSNVVREVAPKAKKVRKRQRE